MHLQFENELENLESDTEQGQMYKVPPSGTDVQNDTLRDRCIIFYKVPPSGTDVQSATLRNRCTKCHPQGQVYKVPPSGIYVQFSTKCHPQGHMYKVPPSGTYVQSATLRSPSLLEASCSLVNGLKLSCTALRKELVF